MGERAAMVDEVKRMMTIATGETEMEPPRLTCRLQVDFLDDMNRSNCAIS